MNPALTQFGTQMSHLTGVRAIMKDIIETLRAGTGQEFINLSAGNPVILPEVEQLWRDCTAELLASAEYGEVVCRYGSSQGYQPLIDAVRDDFNRRYGLSLTDRNILITPGSQSIYFYAANAFGGYTAPPPSPPYQGGAKTPTSPPYQGGAKTPPSPPYQGGAKTPTSPPYQGGAKTPTSPPYQGGARGGSLKHIVLPLSPDYTGYGGVSLIPEAVIACKPTLDIDAAAHRFKYRPDFSQLSIDETSGCVIFSRPCNPTGNVLTDDEVKKIAAMASVFDVPVFIDSAYGPPFPALNYTEMTPIFGENIIHCMSLSKAGLPGERIGIAIGDENIIQVLQSFQTNMCIHSPRYGQAIAARAINSGALADIGVNVIRPYYQSKFDVVETTLEQAMPKDLPWFLHRGEGAIFAWLWLKDLPITDWEFYQQLKQVGVILVPGSSFFPGLREDWRHKQECLRISLTATNQEIETAMKRLAKMVEKVYQVDISPV
ncbi:valine--pyruvate transaminase [Microcoleus sp.]|uniref:valine--pyruvate transaminase n=1 Tax=Microcoleus sp. TaxID=44472 RepID=UPI003524C287